MPSSRVIELDRQADAFNSMSGALTWFQAYVPRALVRQIMHAGDMAGTIPVNGRTAPVEVLLSEGLADEDPLSWRQGPSRGRKFCPAA